MKPPPRLRTISVSSEELTKSCFARIHKLDRPLNAFITLTGGLRACPARECDREQQAGRVPGPLHGIPIALKDNIDTAGVRTTAGSQVFRDRVPAEDAEVAKRLKAAGPYSLAS